MALTITVLAAWTSCAGVARFQTTGGFADNGGRAAVRYGNGAWACLTCLVGHDCPHIRAARAHFATYGAEMPAGAA